MELLEHRPWDQGESCCVVRGERLCVCVCVCLYGVDLVMFMGLDRLTVALV